MKKKIPFNLYLVPLVIAILSSMANFIHFTIGYIATYAMIMLWTVWVLAKYGSDDWRR